MKYLVLLSLSFLLLNAGCINRETKPNQVSQFNYDQAVEMGKQYLIDSGYHDQPVLLLYEPDNDFWNSYSADRQEMLEAYGLLNRTYYAIIFSSKPQGVRDGGATVFVDKDEKRVVGVLYGHDFVKNREK